MLFADRLKLLRFNHHITQVALAKNLNLAERTIRKYEASDIEPTLSVLIALSKQFNISIDWLCGISDNPSVHDSSAADEETATLEAVI